MTEFKIGEVWMSRQANYYLVVAIKKGRAILRTGKNGVGYAVYRGVDKTKGWKLINPAEETVKHER